MPEAVKKIETLDLFSQLDQHLFEVLDNLTLSDWNLPTLAPKWCVKDIVAHLLDGNLRAVSMIRDGYFGEKPGEINSYSDLVGFLNSLNENWVNAMRRISPKVIVALLKDSSENYIEMLKSLTPDEKALFSVAWAGEEESKNWFHIAREYTEKWHHQQQIRYALQCPEPLYEPKFYSPYLETSMRALPHHYKNVVAEIDESIEFEVGEMGSWTIRYQTDGWQIINQNLPNPTTKVIIPKEMAWKILTKATRHSENEVEIAINGNAEYGKHFLQMLAVMA